MEPPCSLRISTIENPQGEDSSGCHNRIVLSTEPLIISGRCAFCREMNLTTLTLSVWPDSRAYTPRWFESYDVSNSVWHVCDISRERNIYQRIPESNISVRTK